MRRILYTIFGQILSENMYIIMNNSLQDSPHLFTVHPFSQHNGIYHCCSFCSSGGSKQASPCGCGCQMPGGYRGCGHGHTGHPGQCHWSCCGSVGEYSDCTRRHYQFTLWRLGLYSMKFIAKNSFKHVSTYLPAPSSSSCSAMIGLLLDEGLSHNFHNFHNFLLPI